MASNHTFHEDLPVRTTAPAPLDTDMEDNIVVNTSCIVASDEAIDGGVALEHSSFEDGGLFVSPAYNRSDGVQGSSSLLGDADTPDGVADDDSFFGPSGLAETIEDGATPLLRKTPTTAVKKPATKKRKAADFNDDGTPKKRPAKKVKEPLPEGRQRRPPKTGIISAMDIARCYDECSEVDKMLIDMKDSDDPKYSWPQIRAAWKRETGEDTKISTLPNRYSRLKDNFSVIKEEDRERLLVAKDEVEKTMAKEKWMLIAEIVKKKGGDSYAPDQLQRQWKKLMVKEGFRPPPGLIDPDYNVRISEDED